jgi:hypothetical protein
VYPPSNTKWNVDRVLAQAKISKAEK